MSRLGPYARQRWTRDALDQAVAYLATAPRERADCEAERCLAMADFTRCALSVLHREGAGRTLRDRLLAAGRIERKVTRGRDACYVLVPSALRRVLIALVAVSLTLP